MIEVVIFYVLIVFGLVTCIRIFSKIKRDLVEKKAGTLHGSLPLSEDWKDRFEV